MRPASFAGAGPGAQTRDGCSVEVYRQLPYFGELDACRQFLRPGTTVLELGCGTGRLTAPLLFAGCAVTVVDNSDEMLAYVPSDAHTIRADIEELRLPATFDVVLLASRLINHEDPDVRAAFIRTAAMHLTHSGKFVLERTSPEWLRTVQVGPLGELAGFRVGVIAALRQGKSVAMTLKYEKADCAWTQSFTAYVIDEEELNLELGRCGFGEVHWLDEKRHWACASLASPRCPFIERTT